MARAATNIILAGLLAATISCTQIQNAVSPGAVQSKSGVLRVADISDPTSLNPMLTGADIAYQLSGFVLEYLVQLDDRGALSPVLCERVPSRENGGISPDGLTVTYHLRRGVRWSDGRPFTASDVVASWKQVMNPLNNVVDREGYDVVTRIDAPDRFTAVVHLAHPYPPFPTRFFAGIQEAPVPVMPEHVIGGLKELNDASFSAHPIGTGPFILQSWEHNGPMTFVSNPDYWQGPPKLRQIVFLAQPSDATELVGFNSHEIDAAFDAGGARLPQYASIVGMHVVRSRSLRLYLLDMNAGKLPLSDVAVRRAIAYAIDRAGMLRRVIHGAGTVAAEWLPSWSWAYSDAVPRYAYEPANAESILDADGWRPSPSGIRVKNGNRLTLSFIGIQGSATSTEVAGLVQAYLRAVGIETTIKLYPYGIVFDPSGPVKTGRFDLSSYSFSVNYDPAALDYDGCDKFPPAGLNQERFCDPIVDHDERLALMTNDRSRRKALYADIERRRMENLAGLPMYFQDRVGVVSDNLQGYSPSRGIIPEWDAWLWRI